MESSPESPAFSEDLRSYIALALNWAWLIALLTFLAGASAFIFSKLATPVYQASTTLLVNSSASQPADYNSLLAGERLARTYAEMITRRPVLLGVIERLGLQTDAETLKDAIQIRPVEDTQLIEIRVEHTDPAQTAAIANALAREFSDQVQAMQASRYAASKLSLQDQLDKLDGEINNAVASLAAPGDNPTDTSERDRLEAALTQYRQTYTALLQSFEQVRLAEAGSTSGIIQVEPAVPPVEPIRPRTLVNTALSAFVGLILSVVIIFLLEAFDDTLKTPEEIKRSLGLPTLGYIGWIDSAGEEDSQPHVAGNPRSSISEAFRILRTNLEFAGAGKSIKSLLVTSAGPGEGKTTVAINLAVIMAQAGRRVVLLDADLRRPGVHLVLHLPDQSGLSDIFCRNMDPVSTLVDLGTPPLGVITSGPLPPNPVELLDSARMGEILEELQSHADIVILDCPSCIVADPLVLSARVDAVLLVVHPGKTRVSSAQSMIKNLQRAGACAVGVALNPISRRRSSYFSNHHYDSEYYEQIKYTNTALL